MCIFIWPQVVKFSYNTYIYNIYFSLIYLKATKKISLSLSLKTKAGMVYFLCILKIRGVLELFLCLCWWKKMIQNYTFFSMSLVILFFIYFKFQICKSSVLSNFICCNVIKWITIHLKADFHLYTQENKCYKKYDMYLYTHSVYILVE